MAERSDAIACNGHKQSRPARPATHEHVISSASAHQPRQRTDIDKSCISGKLCRQDARRVVFLVVERHVLVQHGIKRHDAQSTSKVLAHNREGSKHAQGGDACHHSHNTHGVINVNANPELGKCVSPAKTPRITNATPQNTPSSRMAWMLGSKNSVIISLNAMENRGKMEPLIIADKNAEISHGQCGKLSLKMRVMEVSTPSSASGAICGGVLRFE